MRASAGPGSKAILPTVTEQGSFTFKVDYTPAVAGEVQTTRLICYGS
jgi:hypothetical protein